MNVSPIYQSKDEVLQKAKTANGKRIADFNIKKRSLLKNNKGVIGQVIEEGLFGYPVNSRAEADFANLGLELKVTGLKKLKREDFVVKERLVLNIIDYEKEYNVEFEASSFWKKNETLLLMFYLYEDNTDSFDFPIIDSILFDFSEEDREIIQKDWEYIRDKIKNGEAHLLSEADTMYLGACTKGANSDSYRTQPFSSEPARQRAFCLKNSYMNQIVHKYFINEKCNSILSANDIKTSTFENFINNKLQPYFRKSEIELRDMFSIETEAKNKYERYIASIFGINGKIDNTDEFLKANIKLKTIRIQENGSIKESMSFPAFKFTEIVKEEWLESELREFFVNSKFAFAIFREKKGIYFFEKMIFWNMPLELIDSEVKNVWDKTVALLKTGNITSSIYKDNKGNEIRKNNFPKISESFVMHVRPHGRNKDDVYILPYEDKLTKSKFYTKQCFWLNSKFVKKIVSDN